ncbi:hypothetical protein V3C99_017461 [Haemonchus contortus]
MEQPTFSVRDSPFLKNDISGRAHSLPNSLTRRNSKKISSTHGPCGGLPMLRTSRSIEYHRGDGNFNTRTVTSPTYDYNSDSGSESDLEYGPGIVEKLRAKFQRLSGIVSRDAKVSPHATGKRCPSVDDILSTSEEKRRSNRSSISSSGQSPVPLSSLSRHQSRSTSDMMNVEGGRHPFTLHRTMKTEEQDDFEVGATISELRRKFEISVQGKPSYGLKYAKGINDTRHRQTFPSTPSYPAPSAFDKDFVHPQELPGRISGKYKQLSSVTVAPLGNRWQEQHSVGQSSTTLRIFEARNDASTAKFSEPFRVLEVLNRAGTAEVATNNNDEVPEFIRIGRRLRKCSTLLRKCEYDDARNVHQKTLDSSTPHRAYRAFSPRLMELPMLSNNARVINDDFYEDPEPHHSEVASPPDPDSARERTSHIPEAEPAVFVRTDVITSATNSSPPPEEPKPRVVANDYIPKACAAENSHSILPQTLSQRITPHNEDEVGVTEMQRLLHKFQRARDERQLEERKSVAAFELPSNLPSSVPKRNFVHAVVGVRLSGLPTTSDGQSINGSLGLNKPNVVNISVRSDTSTLPTKQSNHDSIKPRPSIRSSMKQSVSSATTPWPSSVHSVEPRKSLSAKYIEEKSGILSREKSSPNEPEERERETVPYVDDSISKNISSTSTSATLPNHTAEIAIPSPKNTDSTSNDVCNGDTPGSGYLDQAELSYESIAGDGNPVRHSLLSLVMEEDIPALMEAMNETFTCEFEDLNDQSPSTSSILHTPETRKERRKARQVSSIRFEEASPKVYTYLDEVSAIVKKEWVEGVHVDYETYQKILAAGEEEYRNMVTGLLKWKEEMNARAPENDMSQENDEFNVDTSSNLRYSSLTESNTMCV